ncbi:MAG TPA: hypothetical protein VG389_25230 [Myxococcota bacterium]|nr:hypothetical protein [Myxococcota bacterium]
MIFALTSVLFGGFVSPNPWAALSAVALVVGAPTGIGTLAGLRWVFLRLQRAVHPALLIGAAGVVAVAATTYVTAIELARARGDVPSRPAESMPAEPRDVTR